MSTRKFMQSGTMLFIDGLVLSLGNWIYWLLISKMVLTSQVGQATTIISLVILGTSIAQMGLQYPLLKSAHSQSKIIGTTLVIELLLVIILIPVVFFQVNDWYDESQQEFALIAIMIVVGVVVSFVMRFSLLSHSYVRRVLVVTIIATAIKLVTGFILASMGFGTNAILLSFLFFFLTISIGYFISMVTKTSLKFGDIKLLKEVLKSGLANAPNTLSRTLILYLVIVLLPFYGIDDASIGIFYITLMISILVAGSFASSIAYMVIPASSKLKADLSTDSMRVGLSLTVPVIVALLIVPESILSLINSEYAAGSTAMIILSIGVIPFIVLMNSIAKFNNLNKSKELVIIGIVQITSFLIAFAVLVPQFQMIGAALSITIAFFACSILCIIWSERQIIRYIVVAGISVAIGWGMGFTILTLTQLNVVFALIISLVGSAALVIFLKNISISEIGKMIKMIINAK